MKEFLNSIACDKRMHFMMGSMFTPFAIIAGLLISSTLWISLLIAFIAVVVFAFAIEYYQRWTSSGKFEVLDAMYVIYGSVPVFVAMGTGVFVGVM